MYFPLEGRDVLCQGSGLLRLPEWLERIAVKLKEESVQIDIMTQPDQGFKVILIYDITEYRYAECYSIFSILSLRQIAIVDPSFTA